MLMKSEHRKELVSEIRSLAQSQGLNTVFTTFLEITANSLAAQTDPENIRDVVIDKSLPLEERVRSYVEQIKDPYCFKVGDVVVRVSYADKDKSLTDSFTSMIASM